MPANVKDVLDNIKTLYVIENTLETLMDFERVLDELDTYVFKNWIKGELVEGPLYEKYFVTCTFMYPEKMMPDPRGGERLLDYNIRIRYKKTEFEYPVEVDSPDDYRPGTRMPKMVSKPVWLVEITIPKQLMREIHRGSVSLESETIDLEDIKQSYETGLDDDVYKQDEDEQNRQQQQLGSPPNAAQPGQPPAAPTPPPAF